MTIDNLINWLKEAEDNNTWLVSTQSVKRHLEKIKEAEQLTLTDVVKPSLCELYDFGRQNKPCEKKCDSCKWMEEQ
jgi:hypothetical protein